MSKFADYSPRSERPEGPPRLGTSDGLVIREGRASDLVEVAEIAAEREGQTLREWLVVFERFLDEAQTTEQSLLLVAALHEAVIGYGKAAHFSPPPGSAPNVAPQGWYLTGVVVRPESRRRGVGTALSAARLAWIAARSSTAYYVANERNRVSIELHEAIGFSERTRDFYHPGVSFTNGAGILFACDLRRPSS
jgi:ribosomal protein S18 acetylase RimI-like enzyme